MCWYTPLFEQSQLLDPLDPKYSWYIQLDISNDVPFVQWPFQETKLEVPTIYKAYVRTYPQNMALIIWYSASILRSWISR